MTPLMRAAYDLRGTERREWESAHVPNHTTMLKLIASIIRTLPLKPGAYLTVGLVCLLP